MSILISRQKNPQIDDLISGKVSAIEISNVLSKFDCASLCEKILKNYSTSTGPDLTTKIGTSLSSHIYDKVNYFSNAQKSNQFLQKLFLNTISPIDTIHQILERIFQKKISTANESGMNYSDCIIRIHKNGDSVHIHRDNCNFEMSEYTVSGYRNQLSAILYLQSPQSGGELKIYNKQWSKNDEFLRQPDFGYSSDVVNDVNYTTISPISGNLVLLNPNYYHKIESVLGTKDRISIGFFFAESFENNLVCWS
tara:strand:+ start:289 stop:1044 length:756 start_codon:yes stop_codon:yes gene_type:complete